MVAIFGISIKYFKAKLHFVLLVPIIIGAALGNAVSKESTPHLVPCKEGWYLFGDKCYKVEGESERLTWQEASVQCYREGGRLATIDSREKRDFIFNFLIMNAASDTWIGLNDRESEGDYEWNDGSVVNYTDWEPLDPSGWSIPSEDCVAMHYWTPEPVIGGWCDFTCNYKMSYMCQSMKDEKLRNPDPRFCSVEKGGGWKLSDSCYHVVTEKMTWSDAENYCQKNFNGHMAKIHDFRSDYFLKYILSNHSEEFWMDVNIPEEPLQEISSAWQEVFKRWMDDYLTSGCTCSSRKGDMWDAAPCSLKKSFVCETSPDVQSDWQCPESSKDWKKGKRNLCFLYEMNKPLSWSDANEDCMSKGGTLASIHSKEDYDDLYINMKPLKTTTANFFIGLRRNISNNHEFEWVDGGEVSYQIWRPYEPSNVYQECVRVNSYLLRWDVDYCSRKSPYICSARKVPPKVAAPVKPKTEECACSFEKQTDETDVELCVNKITEDITQIVDSALEDYMLSRDDNMISSERGSKADKSSKAHASTTTAWPDQASEEAERITIEEMIWKTALKQERAILFKQKKEEHEMTMKVLNEKWNILKQVSKTLVKNPDSVNLII